MSLTALSHAINTLDPEGEFLCAADHFEPQIPELLFCCTLPPSSNNLYPASKSGHRFPSQAYKAWLRQENPHLLHVLGDWEPDTWRWWHVEFRLWLRARGDAASYVKALLDLLTGTRERRPGERNAEGLTITGSALLHPGAFWDDDKRVRTHRVHVVATHSKPPRAVLLATPAEAPGREIASPARGRKGVGRG